MMRSSDSSKPVSDWSGVIFLLSIAILLCLVLVGGCVGIPTYTVWKREMDGKAELAEAEWSRQIAVQEAQAEFDSAKLLRQAEVERSRGVAEANQIVAEGLAGPAGESYLRYLWVQGLRDDDNVTVIYVPTEANLPIMEAARLQGTSELEK